MEADTRRRSTGNSSSSSLKTQLRPNAKNFRIERCDVTAAADGQSDDDVCDALLNPANLDKELDRLVDPRQRRSSEYEETALLSQRVVVTDPQISSGDTCLTPLLKKSILKDGGRKPFGDDKAEVSVATSGVGGSGVIPKGLRRAFSVQQDSRRPEVKSILNKHLSPTYPEKGEHLSRPIQRRTSKPEPVKAFVRFGETTTVPSGYSSSLSPGLTTRHNFLNQRASFQSDTGKLTQPQTSSSNNNGSSSNLGTSSLLKHDAGIVCSNNDLRQIIVDANNRIRRHSADVRREKLTSKRSLSFDSSMFGLRKPSNAEPIPILYSKHSAIASIASTATAAACTTTIWPQMVADKTNQPDDKNQKHMVQILITSDSPDEEREPDIEAVMASSPTRMSPTEIGAPASRRGSNISNVECPQEQTSLLSPDPNKLSVEEGFKVAWDDSSVVDATILGNAIETYLTGAATGRRLSGSENPKVQTKDVPIQESSLRSSLKSLFVK